MSSNVESDLAFKELWSIMKQQVCAHNKTYIHTLAKQSNEKPTKFVNNNISFIQGETIGFPKLNNIRYVKKITDRGFI